MVKVRDGQVANRPVYVAIGVTLDGQKDILGLWAGDRRGGREVLAERADRAEEPRRRDVFFVVCDGLKGLPDAIGQVWPQAVVQTCIVHLIRNTFRLASKQDWDELAGPQTDLHGRQRRGRRAGRVRRPRRNWGSGIRRSSGCGTTPGPSSSRSWTTTWRYAGCICSTNAIESLNARYRRAVKARGHFPTEQAALKCLYLVTRSLDPTGTGRTRWAMRWKPALNAFAITFGDRFPAAETY